VTEPDEARTGRTTATAKRVGVTGRVQGVFFRDTARREAERRGVAGWVRNRPDGGVEALFEGPPDAVEQMVEWARRGPRGAAVESVDVHDEPVQGRHGFSVR
jgi:acylphosphatase